MTAIYLGQHVIVPRLYEYKIQLCTIHFMSIIVTTSPPLQMNEYILAYWNWMTIIAIYGCLVDQSNNEQVNGTTFPPFELESHPFLQSYRSTISGVFTSLLRGLCVWEGTFWGTPLSECFSVDGHTKIRCPAHQISLVSQQLTNFLRTFFCFAFVVVFVVDHERSRCRPPRSFG